MLRDFRHSLRALLRAPGFAAVAVLTIAIGIGANTAVFSVVNSVLLKPLPYPHAEQLIALWHKAPGAGGLASVSGDLRPSASMYVTYSEQNHSFQSIGIWSAGTVSVTGIAEPEQVPGVFVSDGVLEALDMPPAAGRWLTPADQKPGAPATILLGYGYWQRRFGGDPSAIGRKIMVNSRPREIVGVMPRGFRIVNADADLIAPLAIDRSKLILPGFGFQAVARLKPGITIAAANADIARLIPIWMDSWPTLPGINPHVYDNWRISPAIRPLKQDVVGSIGNILWVVMGTIGIVMLIACVNVANLLLVRAEARQQELAVRAALGAGWGRIVRELLVESVTLGFIGGVLGIAIAQQGLRLLIAAGPANLPRLQEISLDARALAFTAALALLSGFLFGLIPALRYAGPRAPLAIHGGARVGITRERRRTRNLLVVAQVALAMVLLVSSGLMIRTFQALRQVQPGFVQPEQIQLVRITIPQSLVPDAERTLRTENDIVDKLAAIPGVQSVAFETQVPMENIPPNWDVMVPEGRSFTSTEIPPIRYFQGASPGIFHTMGSRMIAGREYNWTDLYGRRPVVIVSENLAREFWGAAAAAIGKRVSTGVPGAPWHEVIGVVEDVRQNGLQEPPPATVYWPALYAGRYKPGTTEVDRSVTMAIRTQRAGTPALIEQMGQAIWAVNPNLPLASVHTMGDLYDTSLARTSFTLVMLAIAGAMALLLGIVGIYGVISYAVSQRRREIGIRMALGAQQRGVERMFVRDGLVLAAAGSLIGLGAAALLTRLMSSLLFGVGALDPITYAAVPVILALAAAAASYIPARRAAAIDPVEALKAD